MAPLPTAQVEEAVVVDDSMDIEAVIAAFLADPTRKTLELPHMTVEQRKQVKKLADQHSELKCESYGLGADRQLHLFKRSSSKEPAFGSTEAAVSSNVSVKNTFIDDWVGSENTNDEASASIVFRSMPPQLGNRQFENIAESADAGNKLELSPISEKPGQDGGFGMCSSGQTASVASAVEFDKYSSLPEGPGMPEGYQVRNTFVHMEGVGPADERIVQSMPHGMFGQCLNAERAKLDKAAVDATVEEMPESPSSVFGDHPAGHQLHITPGTQIVIEGLAKCPAFNGQNGVVQSWDEETERYNILLASQAGGQKWAKVKVENLRLAVPPPPQAAPCYTPTISTGR